MWNEQNWTLLAMPISSTRAEWDEGLRTVRQFNDLLRVLPPIPAQAAQAAGRRPPSPAVRRPSRRANFPRPQRGPAAAAPAARTGTQAPLPVLTGDRVSG